MQKDLIEVLNYLKSLLIGLVTGNEDCNQDDEEIYVELRQFIIENPIFDDMDLSFIYANRTPKFFIGFMQASFKTYENRRIYINDQVNLLIDCVKSNDDILIETTKWNEINKSVIILNQKLLEDSDRININEIGVRSRETIILLANEIYKSKKYSFNNKYGKSIVQDNIKDFFDDYFDIVLKGEHNLEKRKFAKSCIALAHHTTYSFDVNLVEAKMTVIGTTSLIRIVNAIEDDNF